MQRIIRATIVNAGRNHFVFARDQRGQEYFAPFAGFRQPVLTHRGVELAIPGGKAYAFTIGERILIFQALHPTAEAIELAKVEGRRRPLPSAEQWALTADYNAALGMRCS